MALPLLTTAVPYIVKGAEVTLSANNIFTMAKEVPTMIERTKAVIDCGKKQVAPLNLDTANLSVSSYFGVKDVGKLVEGVKGSKLLTGSATKALSETERNVSVGKAAELKRAAIEAKVPKINENLAGQIHPEAGVPFVKKTIEIDGQKIERVFPKFDAKFEAKLPPELFKATNGKQFAECNKQLLEDINKNSTFAGKFNDVQLERIKNLDTPVGYVWHHNEEKGLIQLVEITPHRLAHHVGGKCIWGGGAEYK